MIPLIAFVLALITFFLTYYRRKKQQEKLRATPLNQKQRSVLNQYFPLFQKLPSPERRRLEGLINHFLAEKKFLGGEGLEVTANMRLLIAAQACLLIINKPNRWFNSLSTIIIYPSSFHSKIKRFDGSAHHETSEARAGESWLHGPVVLSWDHSLAGGQNPRDGHNVILHEFAHQLDGQTGVTDGAPLLDGNHVDTKWARIFQAAYKRHLKNIKERKKTIIDPYGATNPAEFFAVCVETFLEQSESLANEEPELYDELATYFKFDPRNWH